MFFQQKSRDPLFRVRGAKATLTVYDACAQLYEGADSEQTRVTPHPLLRESARTPTDESVWGIYIYHTIYILLGHTGPTLGPGPKIAAGLGPARVPAAICWPGPGPKDGPVWPNMCI